jgi:hypothetical protein
MKLSTTKDVIFGLVTEIEYIDCALFCKFF